MSELFVCLNHVKIVVPHAFQREFIYAFRFQYLSHGETVPVSLDMNGFRIVSESWILLLHHKPCTLDSISIDEWEVFMGVSVTGMIHPIVIHTPFNQVRLGFLQIHVRGMFIGNYCCTRFQMFFHQRVKVLSASVFNVVYDHYLSCSTYHPQYPLKHRMLPPRISPDCRRLSLINFYHPAPPESHIWFNLSCKIICK